MDYPVPAYTSFTIPTGATTGARITFNEFGDGAIRVYDSNNNLVEIISPTLGGGSTIIYSTQHTASLQLYDGTIYLGGPPNFVGAASLFSNRVDGGSIGLNTGVGSLPPYQDAALFEGQGGTNGASTGSGNNPFWSMIDQNNTTVVDLYISGSVISSSIHGVPNTWQSPTFQTGWADTAGFGTYPNLKWRYDAENNVHLHGTFHATSATPASLIATGLPPVNENGGSGPNQVGVGCAAYVSGNFSLALFVDNNGNLTASTTGGIASGAGFSVNAKIPIGNLK